MYKYLLFFFYFSLFGNIDEMEVFLTRKEEKKTLYLSPIKIQNSELSSKYINEITETLRFDLEHLEKILLLPKNVLEKQASFFQIQPILQGNLLLFKIQTFSGNVEFPPITLAGNIDEDRRTIHQTLDAFYQKYFHTKSILTTKLLYTIRKKVGEKKWVSEIWSADFDGQNAKGVIQDEHYHLFPCAIPYSQEFLYVSFKTGTAKIYSSNSQEPYITLVGNQILPSITKDGSKVAFISDAAGRPDLFMLEKGNKPIQLYSYPRSTNASPCFDPTGKKIAFVSDKDGAPRIYVISVPDIFGKRPETFLISKKNRENTCPSWSSDGTKLAYSAKTEGIRQIWTYNFETGEEEQLTLGRENKENPTWSVDNSHIVYNTEENAELYLLNSNTKKTEKLTKGPGNKRFAVWQTY